MLKLRIELQALVAWNDSNFESHESTELDAVEHRILRMTELIREIRKIAARN